MLPVDWSSVFEPTVSLIELVVRASLIYLALFALLRLILKREAGAFNLADLLALMLIANAAEASLSRGSHSIPENLLVVTTILGWNYVFDWAAQYSPAIARWVHPPPLPLVKNGRYLTRNMRQELVTRQEIESHLRLAGIEDVRQVKRAFMEGDGRISIVTFEDARRHPQEAGDPKQRAAS